jgi:hypothetical protein
VALQPRTTLAARIAAALHFQTSKSGDKATRPRQGLQPVATIAITQAVVVIAVL